MLNKLTLDNGVRIVSEKIPFVRSVSIGIWVRTGSANENRNNNGISHFIEHMLFKGTDRRTAKDIAESIDNIGGQLNAFTGKECTCYYAKTLDTHMDIAFDVLSDMFFHSKFDKKDLDVERKVIIEEIGMYEDSPEELVHDILSETVWNGHSLGFPILGTQEVLEKIDRNAIVQYMNGNYTPANTVIAVAGNFDDSKLKELAEEYFGHWQAKEAASEVLTDVGFNTGIRMKEKDTEQVHLCIGYKGIQHGDNRLYSLLAVNNLFGGGMSSRLFQKIREEKGLVYSIYSYPSSYMNAGLFGIYAGMNPDQLEQVVSLIRNEVKILTNEGMSKEDIDKSKEQLKGNYILGLESTSSRMNSIGKSELMLDVIYTPEEILAKIDAINEDNVAAVMDEVLKTDQVTFAVVGNIPKGIDIPAAYLSK